MLPIRVVVIRILLPEASAICGRSARMTLSGPSVLISNVSRMTAGSGGNKWGGGGGGGLMQGVII